MKRSLVSASVLASLFVLSASASADPKLSGAKGAKERSYANGPWKALAANATLRLGHTVACDDGCTVALDGGAELVLANGAEVSFAGPTFVKVERDAAAEHAMLVAIERGDVTVRASDKASVLVDLAGARAFVRRGEAQIVAGASSAAIASRGGDVRTKSNAVWSALEAFHAASARGGVFASSHPLAPAPAWTRASADDERGPIALAIAGATEVGASFAPSDGAGGYRVEIARDALFHNRVDVVTASAGAHGFVTKPLPAGGYFARVSTTSADGLLGPASAPRSLRVVAATAPNALVDAARRFILPDGGALHLGDATGLESAFERGGFSAAKSDLAFTSLASKETVQLRVKGDPMSATPFVLERRALRADVTIAPKLPVWPTDPIVVKVELSDPSGKIDPASVRPNLKVMLGIDELKVEWKQTGNTFEARVTPRQLHQNEVVRVVAEDPRGALLGRAFVEVDPAAEKVGPAESALTYAKK